MKWNGRLGEETLILLHLFPQVVARHKEVDCLTWYGNLSFVVTCRFMLSVLANQVAASAELINY